MVICDLMHAHYRMNIYESKLHPQTIKYEKLLPDGWDIRVYWCIYASMDRISIAWCNGLSHVLLEAIIWTSADLLSIVPKIKPSVKF